MGVLEELVEIKAELEKLRSEGIEQRKQIKVLKSERAARDRELKVLRETVKINGLKDGLPRVDERWLYRNGATVEFSLPPNGRRQIKLRAFGVSRPVLLQFDCESEVSKERTLREAVAAGRKVLTSARG